MKRIAKFLRLIADWLDPQPGANEQLERDSLHMSEYHIEKERAALNLGYLDPTSSTWSFIRGWGSERLQKTRSANDSINCDATKTASLRGEIKVLKDLLALPNPKKGLLNVEENDY